MTKNRSSLSLRSKRLVLRTVICLYGPIEHDYLPLILWYSAVSWKSIHPLFCHCLCAAALDWCTSIVILQLIVIANLSINYY